MKKLMSVLLVSVLSGAFAMTAFAIPEFKAAENLIITTPFADDAYIAGGNAQMEADTKGDLYIVGGQVTINGGVLEDLTVAGGKVMITGNVGGDLRVFGGDVILMGNVADDVMVAGGNVMIAKKAVIGGSILMGSGTMIMQGEVKEGMKGSVGSFVLGGKVAKDVIVATQDKIEFMPDAKIGGSLKYSSLMQSEIPAGVVTGTVEFNKFKEGFKLETNKEQLLRKLTFAYLGYKFASYLGILLIVLLMVLAFPGMLLKAGEHIKGNAIKAFGVGLLAILLALIAMVLLTITIVGIPLAMLVLVAMGVGFYLAKVFAALWICTYFFTYNKKKSHFKAKLFFSMAFVLLLYFIFGMIPIVGWLFNLVLFFIGLGGIVLVKKHYFELMKMKGLM